MALRLQLVRFYGGGPDYWMNPDLDPLIVETAVELMVHANRED